MGSTITFSGLASGMDTSSWIEALVKIKTQSSVTPLEKKKTTATAAQTSLNDVRSKVSSLRSSIEKLTDAKFGGSFDIFSKNSVTSSKSSVVGATATNDAIRQNLDIVVNKLATATTAKSNLGSQGLISEDTLFNTLASGNAEEGAFSIFVDGKKSEITIEEDETLGSIMDKISSIDGVSASINDGKFSIVADEGKSLVVGSSSDESNFVSVAGLIRNTDEKTGDVKYESYTGISRVSTSAKLADVFSEDVLGTLKIGGDTFTIDSNTTMKSFIAAINRSEDAGVSAYWDASAGEMVLKSKIEGSFNINVEAGTSNLTNVLGLTSGTVDESGNYVKDVDGNYLSKINDQTLGEYAELTINGTNLVSSSNTVTSDISGIEGLTLTLKAVSKPDDDGVIEPTTISVEQDDEALMEAVKSFITAYNDTISKIDDNTSYGDNLYGDSALTSLRNNLRRTATSSLDSGSLKLLSDIGISTGKASNSTDTTSVNKLQLDEEKFKEALQKNPDAVKSLLVGDNKGTENSGGVLNKLETIVEDSLDTVNGYFTQKNKTYESRISSLETSIKNAQTRVDAYQTRLQNQFRNMESMISSMQSSYSRLSI
ncbi:MAG: flagellar filament capping protein FliD [Candidatus Gastranaerophilaceae bacterium]